MSSINLHKDEIGIKVVYYGPGLGGKTSSIQAIHKALRPDNRGQLISLATGIDRTLYFDFLPVKLPKIRGFTVRLSLYTVPGQVHYNATRKLVLQGADGVVFVADSQAARHEANIESLKNLDDNLRGHGMTPRTVPLVLQYNKRDLPDVLPVPKLDGDLNPEQLPFFETSATTGEGVFDALKAITRLVLADLKKKGLYGKEGEVESNGSPIKDPADATIQIRTVQGSAEAGLDSLAEEEPLSEPVKPPVKKAASYENSGLHHAITSHLEIDKPLPAGAPVPVPIGGASPEAMTSTVASISATGPSIADLWKRGKMREHVTAIEREITKGEYSGAIHRTSTALKDLIEEVGGSGTSMPEALLALGAHGGHYVRYQRAITTGTPSRAEALFCLFFLTDIELRLQEAGAHLVD